MCEGWLRKLKAGIEGRKKYEGRIIERMKRQKVNRDKKE